MEIPARIQEVFVYITGDDDFQFSTPIRDFYLDTIDKEELLEHLEAEFDKDIPLEIFKSWKTAQDAVDYFVSAL